VKREHSREHTIRLLFNEEVYETECWHRIVQQILWALKEHAHVKHQDSVCFGQRSWM